MKVWLSACKHSITVIYDLPHRLRPSTIHILRETWRTTMQDVPSVNQPLLPWPLWSSVPGSSALLFGHCDKNPVNFRGLLSAAQRLTIQIPHIHWPTIGENWSGQWCVTIRPTPPNIFLTYKWPFECIAHCWPNQRAGPMLQLIHFRDTAPVDGRFFHAWWRHSILLSNLEERRVIFLMFSSKVLRYICTGKLIQFNNLQYFTNFNKKTSDHFIRN